MKTSKLALMSIRKLREDFSKSNASKIVGTNSREDYENMDAETLKKCAFEIHCELVHTIYELGKIQDMFELINILEEKE